MLRSNNPLYVEYWSLVIRNSPHNFVLFKLFCACIAKTTLIWGHHRLRTGGCSFWLFPAVQTSIVAVSRVSAVSGGTFRTVVHGKVQRDVWISEMLQTEEIPREPTGIMWSHHSDAETRWRVCLWLSLSYTTAATYPNLHKDLTYTHTLYTPVQVIRYITHWGKIHLVDVVKPWFFSLSYIFLRLNKLSLYCKNL